MASPGLRVRAGLLMQEPTPVGEWAFEALRAFVHKVGTCKRHAMNIENL
jgi:hypothetical protein